MRIAVSGTHGSGKSTLVDDFLARHPEFIHEPEPYTWLEDVEPFSDEPTADDFHRQLELSVERLTKYERGARVIAERSPIDFLAYLLALQDLGRAARDCERIAAAAELAATGMAHLDLLVVLPLHGTEAEDPDLREAMHDRLLDLIATDEYALLTNGPRILEISGTPPQRLRALEDALT